MRRALGAGVVALLLVPAVPAGATCLERGGPYTVDAPTLRVRLSAERASYRRGQVARLLVAVNVGSAEGPKGSDADVAIVVRSSGREVARLLLRTDRSGTASPTMRIPLSTTKGVLTAVATARIQTVPSFDCSSGLVDQTGEVSVDPLLRVV